jgi:hypothetical protein
MSSLGIPNADGFTGRRRIGFGVFNLGGTLRFDYGLQTAKFANGIDVVEGKFIIDKLKELHLLTERNLG